MKDRLFENVNIVAYFLWEHTKNPNALSLWCCAEEVAHYFHKNKIKSRDTIDEILMLGKENPKYIEFMRNISYRIYNYTDSKNTHKNWFMAEKLVMNNEWCNAIINICEIFDTINEDRSVIESIRNESVKNYYRDYGIGSQADDKIN